MPARLKSLDHDQEILVDRPILLFGRHAECDVQLESAKISRKHCLLAVVDPYLVVRDLDSTNGICVNGQRVTEGKLQHGDELTVGNLRFRVDWEDTHGLHPSSLPRPVEKNAGQPAAGRHAEPVDAAQLLSCDFPVPIMEHAHATVGPTYNSDADGRKGHRGAD
jgi:predicted component of type VI protein secretion system